MKHQLFRYIRRLVLICLPFACMIMVYVICDPFKVVRHHDNFYPQQTVGGISLNPAYVACCVYERQAENMGYDSFIFGNSRSIYYSVGKWKSALPHYKEAMHFDAAAESLYGLVRKLEWIDSKGGHIANALFVVDNQLLGQAEPDRHNHLTMVPPQLATSADALRFHLQNIRTFLTPKFLLAYADYSMNGKLKPYMIAEKLLNEDMFTYDANHNEMDFGIMEQYINEGKYYDDAHMKAFENVQQPGTTAEPCIGEAQKQLLEKMKEIMDRHHTNYQFVISPLYNQVKFNHEDLGYMQSLFGKNRIHDFSGKNKWNADFHNYYESSHYRPHVANEIIDIIYGTY